MNQVTLSENSSKRLRSEDNEQITGEVLQKFGEEVREKNVAATVHLDTKFMKQRIEGKRSKKDRLVVTITGAKLEKSQLLGVPALGSTAIYQAEVVYAMLEEIDICNHCKALCYDTTAVNTGRLGGVVILLQHLLGRALIYLACRRHVSELNRQVCSAWGNWKTIHWARRHTADQVQGGVAKHL